MAIAWGLRTSLPNAYTIRVKKNLASTLEMSAIKEYTADEVAEHNSVDDLWVIYNGEVYDVTKYVDEHPGGEEVIVDVAGGDATEAFDDIGHSDEAREVLALLKIGKLQGGSIRTVETKVKGQLTLLGVPVPLVVAALVALGAAYYFLV